MFQSKLYLQLLSFNEYIYRYKAKDLKPVINKHGMKGIQPVASIQQKYSWLIPYHIYIPNIIIIYVFFYKRDCISRTKYTNETSLRENKLTKCGYID